METTIRQFQEEVRDILNQDTWFGEHGIDWLAEDSLDIEYEIKKHLGQTGIVAVVTTPELNYQGECKKVTMVDNEEVVTVNKGFDATISLQIVENPTVNRGKPDKDAIATALDVAHQAVYTLSGYDSGHYNDFNPSTIRQSTVAGAGGKLLQVDCRFTSTPVL